MQNILFGFPVYSDVTDLYTPLVSAGNWESSLPLGNIQDRRMHLVARTVNALAASSQIQIDLATPRAVRLVVLAAHNISSSGTVRIRGNSTTSFATPIYDSGTVSAWSVGMTAENTLDMHRTFAHILASAQTCQYWLIEISDTSNTDGYIQIGRVMVTGGFQPTTNVSQGFRLWWDDSQTVRTITEGGASSYAVRPRRRTISGSLQEATESETFVDWLESQKRHGTSGQMFVVIDPSDTTHLHRRSFVCVHKDLSPIEYAALRYGIPVALVEEL